ncbi:hypothetical protein [Tropicimonas sp. IMCC34011]|uniref:hypothetical protein n=1 Tax=Tropicimonas sp. IMCC34011 TaxID=2248759 RepID=UPI000E25FC18|nr:hypothetical protein [Tropicimonas sp. IMCC34011]
MGRAVIAQIVSGLGNQLLEFGTAYAVAKRLSVPLDLDLTWHAKKERAGQTGRAQELTALVPESFYRRTRYYAPINKRLDRLRKALTGRETRFGLPIWDANPAELEEADAIAAPVYARRVCTDTRIMAPCLPELLPAIRERLFAARTAPRENRAFVHVRLGDYRTPEVAKGFVSLGPDWYGRAMRAYEEIAGPTRWVLCSDEPQDALDMLPDGFDVTVSQATDTLGDLAVMAASRGGVTANSTFSLWGGLLSEGGPVVAPEVWRIKTRSPILPPDWVLI